jgi:hypothetical protein
MVNPGQIIFSKTAFQKQLAISGKPDYALAHE